VSVPGVGGWTCGVETRTPDGLEFCINPATEATLPTDKEALIQSQGQTAGVLALFPDPTTFVIQDFGDPHAFCENGTPTNGQNNGRRGVVDGTVLSIGQSLTAVDDLFLGSPPNGCEDVVDADDDGVLGLVDVLYVLFYLFVGTDPPPAPFLSCGEDPSDDSLTCEFYSGCDCQDCFDQTLLDAVFSQSQPMDVFCSGEVVDMVPVEDFVITVTFCVTELADQCPSVGLPGCVMFFTVTGGSLDLQNNKLIAQAEIEFPRLPVAVEAFEIESTCILEGLKL
jgi:hypothetical protein